MILKNNNINKIGNLFKIVNNETHIKNDAKEIDNMNEFLKFIKEDNRENQEYIVKVIITKKDQRQDK